MMLFLTIAAYYLLAGCVFGVAFFWRGYRVIAPAAEGAGIGLRLLWTPAAIGLWPVLLRKWIAVGRGGSVADAGDGDGDAAGGDGNGDSADGDGKATGGDGGGNGIADAGDKADGDKS